MTKIKELELRLERVEALLEDVKQEASTMPLPKYVVNMITAFESCGIDNSTITVSNTPSGCVFEVVFTDEDLKRSWTKLCEEETLLKAFTEGWSYDPPHDNLSARVKKGESSERAPRSSTFGPVMVFGVDSSPPRTAKDYEASIKAAYYSLLDSLENFREGTDNFSAPPVMDCPICNHSPLECVSDGHSTIHTCPKCVAVVLEYWGDRDQEFLGKWTKGIKTIQ